MNAMSTAAAIRDAAIPLDRDADFSALLDQIGDARIVLLGEATHGTREFYRIRSAISKRLIADKGFDAIAVEADWPDALQASRYMQGEAVTETGHESAAHAALRGFERFPQWMWRNTEIVELALWMRQHNLETQSAADRCGFFGLDLYSLRSSMDAVVRYLDRVDPDAAQRARRRYGCFDHMADDPQRYGYAANFGMRPDCEKEVVQQLVELCSETAHLTLSAPAATDDELFYAQQNARVARNAEAYYRTMFHGRNASWNLRDTHMADTLDALFHYLGDRNKRPARIVVWAHNSHVGDARATEMGDEGQLNLGQLVRERHADAPCFVLGFTTHEGTVTAASDWDAPAERKAVRASLPDSIERLLHDSGIGNFLLPLRARPELAEPLGRRLERAIGVLYLPESERLSHYFEADVARQFDALIHCDHTHALHPLDKSPRWTHAQIPETYPTGI